MRHAPKAHGLVVLVLACLSLFLGGCESEAPLSLLTLREVTPRDLEVGERLEIGGAGFPRGRSARVVLRGTLHRPGAAPITGFEARTEGVVVSESAIEVAYDARLQALFCGPGESAMHTTFRGEVMIAFAAAVPGAPPAAASLAGVVLDLRPPPGSATAVRRMRGEGERLLDSAGIAVEPVATPNGLVVAEVRAGGHAEAAGILAGDLIVSFDGVHVRSVADLVPAAGARVARVGVRRGADPTEIVQLLRVDGYHSRATLAPIFLVAILAALSAIWLFAPTPRAARWLARRVRSATSRPEAWSFVPLVAIPLTVALPLALREILGAEPELLSIALFALAGSLVLHGVTAEGGFVASVRAAIAGTVPLLPAALAVGAAGVLTGATRMTEASHLQGALPWDFVALRGFAMLALFLVAFGALAMPEIEAPVYGRAARLARAGRHAFVFIMATLLTVVFLGGWHAPIEGRSAMLLGALLFVLKAALLGASCESLRAALPVPALGRRALFGTFAAVTTIGLAWLSMLENQLAIVDTRIVGWGLTALLLVATARITWLVVRLPDAARAPRLDPFA